MDYVCIRENSELDADIAKQPWKFIQEIHDYLEKYLLLKSADDISEGISYEVIKNVLDNFIKLLT